MPTIAVDLLKLETSLRRAITGGPSAGWTFEACGNHSSSCDDHPKDKSLLRGPETTATPSNHRKLRAVLHEPSVHPFSRELLRAIFGEWTRAEWTRAEILEAKNAAEYWCLRSGSAGASELQRGLLTMIHEEVPALGSGRVGCGMAELPCFTTIHDRHLYFSLAMRTLATALSSTAAATGTETPNAKAAAAIAKAASFSESAQLQALSQSQDGGYERYTPQSFSVGGSHKLSLLKERRKTASLRVFTGLRGAAMLAMLPVTSSDCTDITNVSEVHSTLARAKEGKGGSHAELFAQQCKQLEAALLALAGAMDDVEAVEAESLAANAAAQQHGDDGFLF